MIKYFFDNKFFLIIIIKLKEYNILLNNIFKMDNIFTFSLYNIDERHMDDLEYLVISNMCETIFYIRQEDLVIKKLTYLKGCFVINKPYTLFDVTDKINELFNNSIIYAQLTKTTLYNTYNKIMFGLKKNIYLKHKLFGKTPMFINKKEHNYRLNKYLNMLINREITLKDIEEQDIFHYIQYEIFYEHFYSQIDKQYKLHNDKKIIQFPSSKTINHIIKSIELK